MSGLPLSPSLLLRHAWEQLRDAQATADDAPDEAYRSLLTAHRALREAMQILEREVAR